MKQPIKIFYFVALAAVLGVPLCWAEPKEVRTPDFNRANAFYESGKFKEAAEAYTAIAAERDGNAAIFYNLANAELRSGNKGKARLWYERALRITPRDPDVLWNLQVLKNSLVDRIEPPPGILELGTLSRMVVSRYSIDEAAIVFSLLLAVWALFSFLVWKYPWFRGGALKAQALLIILTAAVSGLLALKWAGDKDPRVIVLSKEVTARYGPTVKETKAFTLHEGAVARVTDETKDWVYVRLEDSHEGWIQKNSCDTI